MSFSDFLCKSGTKQSSAGYPTGSRSANFSEDGLPSKTRNAGPQLRGVEGREAKPAYCK